jgi:hypothetical protein
LGETIGAKFELDIPKRGAVHRHVVERQIGGAPVES